MLRGIEHFGHLLNIFSNTGATFLGSQQRTKIFEKGCITHTVSTPLFEYEDGRTMQLAIENIHSTCIVTRLQ
jgi:hypothetical protein